MPKRKVSSTAAEAGPAKGQKFRGALNDKGAKYMSEAKQRDQAAQLGPVYAMDTSGWVQIIAVHLASEPKFIAFMGNPQPLEFVLVDQEWLVAIYLPGRTKKYDDSATWANAWWRKNRPETVRRAAAMVLECHPNEQQRIEGSLAPLPSADDKTMKRRQDLANLFATRQKLLSLTKSAIDTQHGLAKKLVVTINQDSEVVVPKELKTVVDEISELDEIRSSAKEILNNCKLNDAAVQALDTLLLLVPKSANGELYMLDNEDMFDVMDFDQQDEEAQGVESEDEDDVLSRPNEIDTAAIQAAVQAKYGIPIDFLGGRTLNEVKNSKDVMSTRQIKKKNEFAAIETDEKIQAVTMLDANGLAHLDQQSADWLKEVISDIDIERFKLNFRDFEKLVERPSECVKRPRGDWFFHAKHTRLIVARDNIVHVRRLVAELVKYDMLASSDPEVFEKLQTTLRRMYAVLALVYGCTAEDSLLLAVMDRLLEDLASLLHGSVDPKLESVRMHNAALAMNKKSQHGKRKLHINDYRRLEREHKAREVFAELARFYRGAVVILHAACSYGKSNEVDRDEELWYKGLLKNLASCGHASCSEQIKVVHNSRAWSVSVAVRDARLGFPAERSSVSTNRNMAYGCLWDLIGFTRFHVGQVVFFHYFAHLWHPACRPFRGKAGLLDDISMMEVDAEKVKAEKSDA